SQRRHHSSPRRQTRRHQRQSPLRHPHRHRRPRRIRPGRLHPPGPLRHPNPPRRSPPPRMTHRYISYEQISIAWCLYHSYSSPRITAEGCPCPRRMISATPFACSLVPVSPPASPFSPWLWESAPPPPSSALSTPSSSTLIPTPPP